MIIETPISTCYINITERSLVLVPHIRWLAIQLPSAEQCDPIKIDDLYGFFDQFCRDLNMRQVNGFKGFIAFLADTSIELGLTQMMRRKTFKARELRQW